MSFSKVPLSDQPNLFTTKSKTTSTLIKNSFDQTAKIVFALCDALGNKNEPLTLANYNLFIKNRGDHFYLLAMLNRQFRLLILSLKNALAKEKNYTQEKVAGQSLNWKISELKNVYQKLVSFEEDVKSGEVDLEIGFLPFLKSLF